MELFILIIFLFTSRTHSRVLKEVREQYSDWSLSCKDGQFISAIQTWYRETAAPGGQLEPSGLRVTCRNPLNLREMQQVQAFDTEKGRRKESRSCHLDEQVIGLNLWPSLAADDGSPSVAGGIHRWDPQILCRREGETSRKGRGRSLASRHTCHQGHALCGLHGKTVQHESKKAPSFTNYGIKCCKLPKLDKKKTFLEKPSLINPKKKTTESKIFTFSLGPPGSKTLISRKPKSKPEEKASLVHSKDFRLKLLINPEKSPEIEEPRILEEEDVPDKEIIIPLTSGNPVLPITIDSHLEKSDAIKGGEIELNPVENQVPQIQNEDYRNQIGNRDENPDKEAENERSNKDALDKTNYQHLEPTNLESRSIKSSKRVTDNTKIKSGLFEDDIVHLEALEKSPVNGKDPIAIIDKSKTTNSKAFQISEDNLLSIEIIPSDTNNGDQPRENIDDYEFIPVYLVQKEGNIFRRSKCLWPKSLPTRDYDSSIDRYLEVSQIRSGQNLIPVLLIKLYERSPPSLRECFWPRVKTPRHLNGGSGVQPEYIVLTP